MEYKCLSKQEFVIGDYSIVPIRYEDRTLIMHWRNEQIFHLRQKEKLTQANQDVYFKEVVLNLFSQEQPSQILFSFLYKGNLVGYGGLVHINWVDKNAEISFLINTELEEEHFQEFWEQYLDLITEVGFEQLKFRKIYTYAFDVRPKLYGALRTAKFAEEARLKDHAFIDNNYVDVLIHSKINRYATS